MLKFFGQFTFSGYIVKYVVNVLCKFYQWSFSYSKLIYTFSGWSEPILAVEQVSSNYC